MSTKELVYNYAETMTEEELQEVVSYMRYLHYLKEEAEEDAICKKMVEDYLNDPEAGKDIMDLDDYLDELGITKDELQNFN